MRLFVAIYPPPGAATAMLGWLGQLDLAEHRPTPTAQLHLTLLFIGDTDQRDLEDVQGSVERSAAGLTAFALTPVRLLTLPRGGRPRLVAVETDSPPTLLEIQRRLAHKLARKPRDRQRFTPHLTICRFTHGVEPAPIDRAVAAAPFNVDRIRLLRSNLRPDGAEHVEIASFGLVPGQ